MSMTREEAIRVFEAWIEHDEKMEYADRLENIEIYKMAIEALKETERNPTITSWYDFDRGYEKGKADARPHGEWLYEGAMAEGHPHCAFNCSVCDAHICRIPSDLPNFCEFCGSDNRPKEGDEKKSCLNCRSSECELGNRARYGFCGNWTMKEGEAE